jgi:DNA polymerase (family X)
VGEKQRRPVPDNREIARVFDDISRLLEVKQQSPFKIRAYHNAARAIAALSEELRDIVARGGDLRDIPGVGEAISSKAIELVTSGRLEYFEKLKQSTPEGVLELMEVPGIGPRTAGRLAGELGITSVDALEAALRSGSAEGLPGIGKKTALTLLKEIETRRSRDVRRPIGEVLPLAGRILGQLRDVRGVSRLSAAGSVRRFVETVGDVDLLGVCRSPADVTERFVALDAVDRVLAHGPTRASIVTRDGLQVDLRIVEPLAYGSLLQYFTGSKEHNVALREFAIGRGLKLSEYGITEVESGQLEQFEDEESFYRRLGLSYIPPEVRENTGEIELAERNDLPALLREEDVRGDLHVHTNWSDGSATLEDMVAAAARCGYEYVAVTDHSSGIPGGLDADRLLHQGEAIRRVNESSPGCTVLRGIEVNVRADGSLDLPDDVLGGLDLVIAAVHSSLGQDRATMTARIVRALENPHVDILAHPTSRLLGQREPCDIDLPQVFRVAAATGTLLELNAMPDRLDLSAAHAREAHERGVLLSLGTDAHSPAHLAYLKAFGVRLARRAWCGPEHVVNSLPLSDLRSRLKRHIA